MDNRLLMFLDDEDELYGPRLFNKFLSSSDEDSDEPVVRRPKIIRPRSNRFSEYDNVDFIKRFRLSKQTAQVILNEIRGELEAGSGRNHPVSPENQLLIALRFYATGNFQLSIGDYFNVSNSTVSRIVHRVTLAIGKLRSRFLNLPQNENELLRTCSGFQRIGRIPNVLGVINCMHVKIQSPGGEHAKSYKNREGWFSINVQAVCSSDMKFSDVVARWPGGVQNSTIFDDSLIRAKLQNNKYPNCYLLGNAGYACNLCLLTPLESPITPAEIAYNSSHLRTMSTIERAFSILMRRFPCLSVGMRLKMETTVMVIVVTMMLHNIAISNHDPEPDADEDIELPVLDIVDKVDGRGTENTTVRTALINTIFQDSGGVLSASS